MKSGFQKKVENFICQNCDHQNIGTGFTNHCAKCLWSKHVDMDPGDRQEGCGGMMEPVDVRIKNNELGIMHKCKKCGFERWCLVATQDSLEKIPELIAKNQTGLL